MSEALSIAQIAEGMDAARGNAADLIADAAVLYPTRKSRSYALTHTACEELAKFFILSIAGRRLALRHRLDWKRFWNRYRSHDSKGAQIDLQSALSTGLSADEIEAAALPLVVRNASLYSDLGPDRTFRSPSDIDWTVPAEHSREVAKVLLSRADAYGKSISDLENELRSSPSGTEKARAAKIAEKVIRLAMNSGTSSEDLQKVIRKVFGEPSESKKP